jgi:hypothetical protein
MGRREHEPYIDHGKPKVFSGLVINAGMRCSGINQSKPNPGNRKWFTLSSQGLSRILLNRNTNLKTRTLLLKSNVWRDGYNLTRLVFRLSECLTVEDRH